MGAAQSDRATHFDRWDAPADEESPEEIAEDHHISISNKMVERLVEDAALAGTAAQDEHTVPREDSRDRIFIEKLQLLDEKHSERLGLTLDNLTTMASRLEQRAAGLAALEPACARCREQLLDCYTSRDGRRGTTACWDAVEAFSSCVRHAAAARLTAQSARAQRAAARRSRQLAHARGHALRDYGPGPARGREQVPPV